MSQNEKNIFIKEIQNIYYFNDRKTKKTILDQICDKWGHNRKYAIRLLKPTFYVAKKPPGPQPKYDPKKLLPHLKKIWLASNQMCSKKLKAALPLWLPHYETGYETLEPEAKEQLLQISSATIDRLLKPIRVKYPKKGLCGTKPGTLLKHQIPIKTHNWDITKPGFMEADTVAHCGDSLDGSFIWSLTLTDIYSGWTEIRATWNKGSAGVIDQIKNIETTLPFPLQGFDCDNGSEFLNHHLVRYFAERPKKVGFTRSRPYRKNDNAHVEQKNWTHVRQLFHYHRIDNPALVALMNDIYSKEWSLLQNFYSPSMKLLNKHRINAKYQKTYSKPLTPYQRLLGSPDVSQETKTQLQKIYVELNPFQLQKNIKKKIDDIFRIVGNR